MTPLQRRYSRARRREGVTVAEFEARERLPQYSVYPEARFAKFAWRAGESLGERGFFMYRNATDEEKGLVFVDEDEVARLKSEQHKRWAQAQLLRAGLKAEAERAAA